jgi:hypothetical protein
LDVAGPQNLANKLRLVAAEAISIFLVLHKFVHALGRAWYSAAPQNEACVPSSVDARSALEIFAFGCHRPPEPRQQAPRDGRKGD